MVINIPGLPANDPVPGTYLDIQFAQGPASSGSTVYNAILIGNKLPTGSALDDGYAVYGPDTDVQLVTEEDCIQLFGAGSELHRMWRRFNAVNKSTALYAVCVKESTGVQATGDLVFSGTATAAGTVRVFVGTASVDAGIVSGDSPTVIAAAVADAINGQSSWAVTASALSGTVTLTAKQKGLRGNAIDFQCQIIGYGTGVSVSPGTNTRLSGGTVADSNLNALAAIASTSYYYQVSAAEDATQVGSLADQIDSNAAPIIGIRNRGVFGAIGSLAATTTIATGINAARMECVWQQNSDMTPAELAANDAAIYALQEQSLGAPHSLNYDSYGLDSSTASTWFVPAPRDGTVVSRASVKSALMNGITPIAVSKPGQSYLVKRITTRSLSGSVPDYRTRDSHIVTVCDFFGNEVVVQSTLSFSGSTVANDPAPGQQVPGPAVVTPRIFKALLLGVTQDYAARDLIADSAQTIAQTIVERGPANRLSALVPLKPIDLLDQIGIIISQQ